MKKKKSLGGFIGAFVVTIVVCFFIYECNSELNSRRERLEGVWLVDDLKEPVIITLSTSYGHKSGQTSYIRVIDPETGKILGSQSFGRDSWSGDELKCMTATSIWVDRKEEWLCLDFPSLKKRWNKKSFFTFLRKTHPEMGDPYEMKMTGSQLLITNKEGKTFWIGVREVETNSPNPTYYFQFDEMNELGRSIFYLTPESRFAKYETVTIELETFDEPQKKYNWSAMNIREKLLADTGYAKNYAVFSPDSACYFFDGNHSRIAYKLVNDSLELIWKPVFDKREWLEGDFLRPYKPHNMMAENRLITTKNNIAFIHYWTSLDEKENKLKLAGVDLTTEKILWDIDLTPHKIKHGCRPENTEVLGDILIIVWIDNGYAGTLTGIDVNTGEVKWVLRK